jgi:hypothetical protein
VTIAFVTLAVVVVALLADRWQQRHRPDPSLLELISLCDRLCQRLQAPQAAILEHDEQVRTPQGAEYAPPAVPPDDDEAFWMSRERLAEMTMAQETSGRD